MLHTSSSSFLPHVLREYAFLADGERGALIGPRGDVAWMCAPRWHDDAVFASLLGATGGYAVTPTDDRYVWGGRYEDGSMIWRSRWVTGSGIIECREALARPADPRTAVILRRVRALSGTVRVSVVLDVRAAFGAEPMAHTRHHGGSWTGRSGPLQFRWSGGSGAHRAGPGPLVCELHLEAGEEHDLILELSDHPITDDLPVADRLWEATEAAWDASVPAVDDRALAARDAEQAVAVLAGLTSAAGGMVAASTTSLPERAGQGRNYDYRYAWIRDQSYAGIAAATYGNVGLVDPAVRFVAERLLCDGPNLRPAYRADGGAVPDQHPLDGPTGYPGAPDRVGNWVNGQFQLDAFGEALELFAAAGRLDRLGRDEWGAVETAVAAIEARWTEPDAGIWELDEQRWAHSRLTCVSGLRAISAQAPATEAGRWSALADVILADVSGDCLHVSGRWQRSPTDSRVDAALLLPAIRGAIPPEDPRSVATVAAVTSELTRDEYVYRFRHDARPLGEAEGAFLLCGFLLALAKHHEGDQVLARALFERNRAACGSPGLLAEEFDINQRQLRGNLPQAFVHALLLECSAAFGGAGSGESGVARSG
jgi:hypothetical protein